MGFGAKYTDGAIIGAIGTNVGVWILTATVLAAWSRSPKTAALHVFVFFSAMLIVYYIYSAVLFGFFPKYYLLIWGFFALLSPIGAYIIWYARGNGWIASLCSALPIALLLTEGYSFYYTFSIPQGFDLCAAVLLFAILPAKGLQRLYVLPIAVVMAFMMQQVHLLSYLFGGL